MALKIREEEMGFYISRLTILRIRAQLARINASEGSGEDKEVGLGAKAFVSKHLPVDTAVMVQTIKDGKFFNRYIMEVWRKADGVNINDLMVNSGHAVLKDH